MVKYAPPLTHDADRGACFRRPQDGLRVGPRQCGKTTLAKKLLRERRIGAYHNWDEVKFRRLWAADPSALVPKANHGAVPLVVLDQIHKDRRWKRALKGVFDTRLALRHRGHESARLNVYLKGGDSLFRRHLSFRLHPFSVTEMGSPAVLSPDAVLACLSGAGSVARRQTNVAWRTCSSMDRSRSRSSRRTRGARLWRRSREQLVIREDLATEPPPKSSAASSS